MTTAAPSDAFLQAMSGGASVAAPPAPKEPAPSVRKLSEEDILSQLKTSSPPTSPASKPPPGSMAAMGSAKQESVMDAAPGDDPFAGL